MIQIIEIIKKADQGFCKPFLCKGNDGYLYYVKGFIDGRVAVVHEELPRVFGLPEVIDIKIEVFPLGAATVHLNTLDIEEFPFEGKYYSTNKIDLTAVIKIGEIFEYWENLRTGERITTLQIQIDPQDQDHWVVVCHSSELFELRIAPNPAEDVITVGFAVLESSPVEVSIVDLQGKVVKSILYPEDFIRGRYELKLNLSDLPAGQYILFLTTESGKEASQFIKL